MDQNNIRPSQHNLLHVKDNLSPGKKDLLSSRKAYMVPTKVDLALSKEYLPADVGDLLLINGQYQCNNELL